MTTIPGWSARVRWTLVFVAFCGTTSGPSWAQSLEVRSVRDLTMVCAGCHYPEPGTLDLNEAQRIPKLGGQQRDYLENALQAYRTRQRDHFYMRGMALGLKGADLQRVLDHLAAPATSKAMPKASPSMPIQAASCVACHGDQARPPLHATTPRLSGQHATYIELAFTAYAQGRRQHPEMTPQAIGPDGQPKLSDESLRAVAQWFEGLPGLVAR